MRALLLAVALAAPVAGLRAQGGPPMLTDDPGTPGPGHWELNFSAIVERTPGLTDADLPYLDLNYGIGDRVQLTWQVGWVTLHQAGEPAKSGLGDEVFGLKWRFLDEGDGGWQVSAFPQVTFLAPGSHSDRRGLAAPEPGLLLPVEVERDLGPVSANLEIGRVLAPQGGSDLLGVGGGWIAGLALGRQVGRGLELDAEVHAETGPDARQAEWIAAAGTRLDTSKNTTLLLSIGRDMRNTLSARTSLLAYIGFQVRL